MLFAIRPAVPDDAAAIIDYLRVLFDEPDNGTSYDAAAQLTRTEAEQRALIEKTALADNALWQVAVTPAGALIGNVSATGGPRGLAHTLTLGISVARDWRNQGVGRALLLAALAYCQQTPAVHRLELEVITTNARAIHLYERLGFQREGIRRQALKKHGHFVDLLLMSHLFEGHHA
jgi:putative acetyltransferase